MNQDLPAMMGGQQELPCMIVVMGVTGAGKSYFINKLAGREVSKEGSTLDSCTERCQLIPVSVGNTKTLLIDTPGFDDPKRKDGEILTEIAQILSAQYELGVKLKGIIYIHRITDVRYSGASVKTYEIFKKMCGETALSNVSLITSRWGEIDQTLGADRERELKAKIWAYMLGKGSNVSRFHGDRASAIGLVSQLLCKEPVVLQLQKELVDEGKKLNETAAGAFVSDGLEKLRNEYEEQLASLERLKEDLMENDRAMKRQYEADLRTEKTRLQQLHEEQICLNRPVGAEVREEIKNKGFSCTDLLPLLPIVIKVLGAFLDFPIPVRNAWAVDLDLDDGDFDFFFS